MVLTTNSASRKAIEEDNGCKVGIDSEGKGYLIKPKDKAEEIAEKVVEAVEEAETIEEAPKKKKKRSRK